MSRPSKGQREKAVETALAVRKRCGLDVPKPGAAIVIAFGVAVCKWLVT